MRQEKIINPCRTEDQATGKHSSSLLRAVQEGVDDQACPPRAIQKKLK